MSNFDRPQFNLHNVDLTTIDGGRLIYPSKAEGPGVHNLKVEGLIIPVSFTVLPEGRFRINGLQEGGSVGLVMSGFMSGNCAKINHVKVEEDLRNQAKEHGGVRVGEAALLDLEQSLKEKGATISYAVFSVLKTIEFFRRNGYKVSSIGALDGNIKTQLGIKPYGFNKQITNDETFEQLKENNKKQVLLEKQL